MKVLGWKYYFKAGNNYEYDRHIAKQRDGEVAEVINRNTTNPEIVKIRFISDDHTCWVMSHELSTKPVEKNTFNCFK